MFALIILSLAVVVVLLSVKATRGAIIEEVKHLSDKLLLWFLRVSSQFEGELTQEGRTEQATWRDQRLRDLQGLAIRSRQRFEDKDKSASA